MIDLIPNIDRPVGNAIAIFDYNGTPHVAITKAILNVADKTLIEVSECNYKAGSCDIRWINIDIDKHLKGFYLLSG